MALHLGDKTRENSASLPSEKDFKMRIVETMSGEPHPDTGIPPSFLVVKCDMLVSKSPQLNVDMGRPTEVHFSLSRLNDAIYIKNKVS